MSDINAIKPRMQELSVDETFENLGCKGPALKRLEEKIASLEHAKYGLCFPAGMGALNAVVSLLSANDHVICFEDIYGGTSLYFRTCLLRMGIEVTFCDLRDIENLKKDIRKNTKMVWFESPTNPTLKMVDIELLSKTLKNYPGVLSVIDNTFLSPYFQRPLALGADIVMHSLTKYINGHSDVIMGALATNSDDLFSRLKFEQNYGVPSALDCFLVYRGLQTLSLRMDYHQENAFSIAKFLENHPAVERVVYPGLKSHPQHELANRQCSGFGGMIAFYVKGKLPEAEKVVTSLKIIAFAGSLGSFNSLIEIPTLLSHKRVPEDIKGRMEITENLIRLSVGIESVEDLINDLDQALKRIIPQSEF